MGAVHAIERGAKHKWMGVLGYFQGLYPDGPASRGLRKVYGGIVVNAL